MKNNTCSVEIKNFGTRVYTDMELAQLFIRRVPIRRKGQQVYVFNGEYYRALAENEFHTMILECLREEIGVSGRSQRISFVANALLVEPDIRVKEREIDPGKICLLDGILDIRTLQLRRHTPMYFIDWQLNSMWGGSDFGCPNFDRFLRDVTDGDPILLKRFWQATGYLLLGEGNIAKRVFILTGPTDAGKSVFGALLRGFHHPEQISSIDAFKLGDRFVASALVNARLNLAMDLPYGSLQEQAVGMIKSISGSDAVTVEAKYRTPYTARLDCKLVFGTNHPIRATVVDRALARRLMVLPFRHSVPKSQQDPYLLNRLLTERPAILRRAAQEYYTLRRNNYVFEGDNQFNNDAFMGIADDSVMSEDVVEQFVNACCINAPEQFISTEQLHEAYKVFCQSIGNNCIEDCQPFSARLRPVLEAKFQAKRGKRRVGGVPSNGYIGVRLISESL